MADVSVNTFPKYHANAGVGSWPVANGVTLYVGGLYGLEGGYLNHWADGTADVFLGVLLAGDDRNNDGVILGNTGDSLPPEGRLDISGAVIRKLASVGGTPTQAKVGDPIYCSTSNTDDMTLTVGSLNRAIGWLSRFRSSTDVDVTLHPASKFAARAEMAGIVSLTDSTGGTANDTVADAFTQGAAFTDNTGGATTTTLAVGVGMYSIAFFLDLATITAADIVTDYIVGHKFKLIKVDAIVETAATTASKDANIILDIGSTATTGGIVSMTSANMTPKGVVVAGTAITGNDTGSNTATLTIRSGTVASAFSEGSAWIVVQIQNMDLADALAGLVTQANLARTDATTGNDNDADLAVKINEILATE